MKHEKEILIITSAQTILVVLSMMYALFQREEAIRQRDLAVEMHQVAEEQRMLAAKSAHDLDQLKQEMLKVSSPCP